MKKYFIIAGILILGTASILYFQYKRKKNLCIEVNDIGAKFIQKGQPDSAIVYFEKATLIDPTNKRPYQNLISAYLDTKKYEQTLSTLNRYLHLSNLTGFDSIASELTGGIAYYCLGKQDSATIKWTRYDNYYKMKEKQSHKFDNGFERIFVLIWLGKNQECTELCNELKKESPDKSEIIDDMLKNPYALLKCRQ